MNYQRGVSLIIVFFIMMIILSVVLSISTILYTQLKNVRNTSDSVISYYAAESGIEQVNYDIKKNIVICAPATGNSCQISTPVLDNNATYTVTAVYNGTSLISVSSVGTYDNANREIDKSF